MKIIFVLPNLSAGGAERVVSILSRKFVERGISVAILLLIDNKIQYKIFEQVEIVELCTAGMSVLQRVKKIRDYLKIEKKQNNIILVPFQDSCLKNVLAASFMLHIPVIACERNNPYRKGNGVFGKIKAEIPFIIAKHCIFQTPDARAYYKLLPDRKCDVIINPISPAAKKWQHVYDANKLVMVGRLHSQKNYTMLIDAITIVKNTIPSVCVHVYGEGALLEMLRDYADRKGAANAIVFEGRSDDIQGILSQSSIFLLSSDFEGLSNAMLEAMSVGMPVICTDCPIGGAKMMLSDNAGVLTPVGDPESFAKEIVSLLSDHDRMDKLGKSAMKKTIEFSEDSVADCWEKVFFMIKNKGGR